MKRLFLFMAMAALPGWLLAQQTSTVLTPTLKINNIHIELNGQKVEWDKTYEFTISDKILSEFIIFEQEGIKYGSQFTYKKGTNRLKFVRRGYVIQTGKEIKFGKKEKDMQVIRTSIPGSLNKRVVENILISKDNLQAINVSYNYELIYK